MRVHLDYETRSPVDLIGAGQYAYAEHSATQVILAAWAIDDEPFEIWRILRGDPIPERLKAALLDPDCRIIAHNAAFERVISAIVGYRQGFLPRDVWAAIKDPMRWSCTAARAAACGLPRALEKVAKALELEHQKDMEGHRLMLEMCAPRGIAADGSFEWLDDELRIKRLGEYCIADGLAERDIDKILPDLKPFEQEVYAVTEKMNDRGVAVDTDLLMALMVMVRAATTYLNERIRELTNNEVPAVTNPGKIKAWLKEHHGIEEESLGKWIIAGLLEDEDLPAIVREVLVIRRDGGKSSTAKYNTLLKRLNRDNRIRGALLYAGAAATSRWSSRGVQLQNLPRVKVVKKMDEAIRAVIDRDITVQDIERMFGPPMVVASELARPTFVASPDCWLARGDYSQIETRVTAWLAGEDRLLQAFREYDTITGRNEKGKPIRLGPDLYIVTAADICGVAPSAIDEDDPRRQIGKVTILACSFGGGVNALYAMAKIYGLKVNEETAAAAVRAFRNTNANIKSFWYDLDNAAVACMKDHPGQIHQVRSGVWFKRDDKRLAMHLPSGRWLVYWYPALEKKTMPWFDWEGNPVIKDCVTYMAEDAQKHIWTKQWAWHGLWCENAVQATARDIMAYALVSMERKGMNPVLTVHDEAICQLLRSLYPNPKDAAEAVKSVMLELPDYAISLPIAAEASAGPRYVKG